MPSILLDSRNNLKKAAKIIGLDQGIIEILSQPKQTLEVSIPIRTKNGIRIFQGWRVQFNDVLGPYKGGIRFNPEATLEEVKGLALLMVIKTALLGLPFGGAKGGVVVNPRDLSTRELEELSRKYVDTIFSVIGPEKDVPASDMGTNPQIMAWMSDEFSKLKGYAVPAAFTGKPIELGGSEGRDVSTAYTGLVILLEFIKNNKRKASSVGIQGFGNVGANIAKLLYEKGFKIVALSDIEGLIYNPEGIDVSAILKNQKTPGLIEAEKKLEGEKIFELPVDILVPAAKEYALHKDNAADVKAKVILEMANGAVTVEAENILEERGVEIIPDVLANSGGVMGSYLEWAQNSQNYYWKENEVLDKLKEMAARTFNSVLGASEEHKTSLRTSAYIIALKRLAKATKERGWTN